MRRKKSVWHLYRVEQEERRKGGCTLLCFINTVIWLRIRLLGAKLPSFRTILVQNYILYASTFLSSVTGMSRGFTYQFANIKQADHCYSLSFYFLQWHCHCILAMERKNGALHNNSSSFDIYTWESSQDVVRMIKMLLMYCVLMYFLWWRLMDINFSCLETFLCSFKFCIRTDDGVPLSLTLVSCNPAVS